MRRRGRNLRANAFTLVELAVVIFVAAALVLGMVVYGNQVRPKSQLQTCRENLKQVGLAFKTWPPDSLDAFPMTVSQARGGTKELVSSGKVFVHFRAMSNEVSDPKVLVCPSDTAKDVASGFTNLSDKNVSYFIGLDSEDARPYTLLSGDRNLALTNQCLAPGIFTLTTNMPLAWTTAIHGSKGNVLLADGSVGLCDSARLSRAVVQQELATNRLVIP